MPVPEYRNIYIMGGHALAAGYAKTLIAANKAGRIVYQNIFCVTEETNSKALTVLGADNIICKSPSRFVLDTATSPGDAHSQKTPQDILVPDHTAKHLLLEVFMSCARETAPEQNVALSPIGADLATPFSYPGENGALLAVSYATWACPADCDEPDICPHTQTQRDWDFHRALPAFLSSFPDAAHVKLVYGCQPLIDQISFIPLTRITDDVNAFKERLKRNLPLSVFVATHSRCHGIIGKFTVNTDLPR